ncbi:uncharacterized protein LOC120211989 [Hibiscus syriacus]|uniref:uncharacterized protein LOC120211989 n=1 Tax=Hibiscus syriacus TaxID=106335 RepID=UPI001921A2CC|nr:uncharacterized protein LOC120211989 [Hibiscus syriacus]
MPHFPGQPLPPSSMVAPTDLDCFSTLLNVPGCVINIFDAMLSGEFDRVNKNCCDAFSAVGVNCWPVMFDADPSFPPLLKDYCTRFDAAPPEA